jgi:hypothetical protein
LSYGRHSRRLITVRIIRSLIIVVASVLLIAALPRLFVPKRWHEIHPGQHRNSVIAVLGLPDADYFNAKSFDGWFNPFFIGAATMTVGYAENSDIVRSVRIRTEWGFAYRNWARGEAKELSHAAQRWRLHSMAMRRQRGLARAGSSSLQGLQPCDFAVLLQYRRTTTRLTL